jgi:hypothetical protein
VILETLKIGAIFSFQNNDNIATEYVTEQIIKNLYEGLYFKADDLNLPDLHFEEIYFSIDHDWHEFYSCSTTTEETTDPTKRDIKVLITKLFELKEIGKYNCFSQD